MAHGVDKDEFLYDLDNLTQMMETSKILDGYETTGARPKKAKAKRTSSQAAGESKAKPSSDTPPEPSITASLELEKPKNQNLKLQLEIRKAELELAWLKERPSTEPLSTAMDAQSPCLLENAITSTPSLRLSQFNQKIHAVVFSQLFDVLSTFPFPTVSCHEAYLLVLSCFFSQFLDILSVRP